MALRLREVPSLRGTPALQVSTPRRSSVALFLGRCADVQPNKHALSTPNEKSAENWLFGRSDQSRSAPLVQAFQAAVRHLELAAEQVHMPSQPRYVGRQRVNLGGRSGQAVLQRA